LRVTGTGLVRTCGGVYVPLTPPEGAKVLKRRVTDAAKLKERMEAREG
jgi:hypothetical protein